MSLWGAPLLVDTSGLIAALFADQRHHEECARVLRDAEQIILSPFVLAETDYLIQKYGGIDAEIAFLEDVGAGAYLLVDMSELNVKSCVETIKQYRRLNIGLADASLVALARIYDAPDILTLDRRHFETLRIPPKRPFRIHPKL